MSPLPFVSLAVSAACLALAWQQRAAFTRTPYVFWFIYLHLAAVGLHQFEEYGWPGGFREAFVAVFQSARAEALVPSLRALEVLNAFGFTLLFGAVGWLGTRVAWIGLTLLFVNSGNGFFHLVYSVTQMDYLPGAVTGTLLYMPLALLATRHALLNGDVTATQLLRAFAIGTAVSFAPFLHVWMMHLVT